MGVERYQVAGLLQVGDENGPIEGEVGYGESVPNATVQIRGQTSSPVSYTHLDVYKRQGQSVQEFSIRQRSRRMHIWTGIRL